MASVCYDCQKCGHYSATTGMNGAVRVCEKCGSSQLFTDWDEAGDYEVQDANECEEEE